MDGLIWSRLVLTPGGRYASSLALPALLSSQAAAMRSQPNWPRSTWVAPPQRCWIAAWRPQIYGNGQALLVVKTRQRAGAGQVRPPLDTALRRVRTAGSTADHLHAGCIHLDSSN